MPEQTRTWIALRRYMVAGVLVWLPILATIWVVSFMLHIMDRTLLLLPPSFRPQALVGFALPGAGLVLALVIVLLLNGYGITRAERALEQDSSDRSPHWPALRRTAIASLCLWFTITLAGIALVNLT